MKTLLYLRIECYAVETALKDRNNIIDHSSIYFSLFSLCNLTCSFIQHWSKNVFVVGFLVCYIANLIDWLFSSFLNCLFYYFEQLRDSQNKRKQTKFISLSGCIARNKCSWLPTDSTRSQHNWQHIQFEKRLFWGF